MKLIITGANGFIGKHLCRRLQVENCDFTCVVRSESSLEFFEENRIPVICVEREGKSLTTVFNKENANGIVHLASHFVAEHQDKDLVPLVESNILFGTQLLDAAVKSGIKWFLNTGTFWQHYNASDYDPVNLYAATKQALEDIGRYYANAHGLHFCTLKLCDTYGAGDTRNKLYSLWERISKSGETLRMSPGNQLIDIVHVDIVVDSYLRLIKALNAGFINKHEYGSYYISSGRKITLKELAREYELKNGVKLSIIWGGRSYRPREVMVPACVGQPVMDLPGLSEENEARPQQRQPSRIWSQP